MCRLRRGDGGGSVFWWRWRWCCSVGINGCGSRGKGFPRDVRRRVVYGGSGRDLVDQGCVGGDIAVKVVQAGSDVEFLEILEIWFERRENDV